MKTLDTQPFEILLVEDSPSDAVLTIKAFEKSLIKKNLNRVKDGIEALEYLKGEGVFAGSARPDVIMLDLNLPRKDGFEVLAEIKNDPVFKAIPVIIFSTSNNESDVRKCYELNANCYIVKPFDFKHLIEVIKTFENFWLSIVKLPLKI